MPVAVWLLALIAWLYFVALDMHATGLPLSLTAAGFSTSWVGFLSGFMGLAAAAQRPFLAAWGDRRGHRLLLAVSLLAAVAGGFLFAAGGGPAAQVAARTLQGTSLAGVIVATQALIAGAAPPPLRGRALALQGLADTGGVLVGPALGVWAWQAYGDPGLYLGAAALMALALLITLALPRARGEEPAGGTGGTGHEGAVSPARPAVPEVGQGAGHGPGRADPESRRELHLAAVVAMGFVTGTVFGAVLNLTVLHARATGYQAGVWLGEFAVVAMLARYGAGLLVDRGWDERLLPAAFAVMAAGSALMMAAGTPARAYAVAVILAAGYGAVHTTLVARVVARAPAERRGAAAGWLATSIDLGVGLGVTALGRILDAHSFPAMYGAMAAVALAGALVARLSSTGPGPRPGMPRSG